MKDKPNALTVALSKLLKPLNIAVRECAWCRKLLGFRKGMVGITDGICKKCEGVQR